MKALSWMRARPKTLASVAGVAVGAVALTTMALAYDGNPTTEVDLHDGGVWITKSTALLVGHFNNESVLLDGGLRTSSAGYDILQNESTVLVVNHDDSTVTTVDPARVELGDSTGIPDDGKVVLGGATTAILDPSDGELWVVPASSLSGFEVASTEPLLELGENADVVVGQDGTVFAVSAAESAVYTIPVDAQGAPGEPSRAGVDGIEPADAPTITAVGRTPVVLDAAAGAVVSPGGIRVEIDDADTAVLQQASADARTVAVATASHLLRIPLDGGDVESTSSEGQGRPAAPVSMLGCAYGAWSGSARFVRACDGGADDLVETIPGLPDTARPQFRVNRDVIVLNDVVGGAAWTVVDALQQVDNWNDITPPEGDADEDLDTTEEEEITSLPERTDQNTAPVAEDDDYGVRPGGSTRLPVTDNDTDADGDVLVARLTSEQPGIGDVQPIDGGSALQIAVPDDATGTGVFEYGVDDGRGGTDTATVTVSVHGWETNSAPVPKRQTALTVESGGAISYNVLPDWIDPDGDDVFLEDVTAVGGDEVEFTPDGQLSYRAVASAPGRYELAVTVSDAAGETASGTIRLDVRPAGSTEPKTNADHVVTRAGEQITVAPLGNDTSSSREPLRLANVKDVEGATIVPDYAARTFDFRADSPGVYYVQYLVTAGAPSAIGLVRIDVTDPSDEDLPPVAVRDVALLPTGGEVLVDVLNNDTDPAGGILVVQSVSVEPGSGVSVSVLNHETLRIGDQGALDQQVRIAYRISNGSKSAEGDVVVVPVPAPDKILPPVANDDEAIVRVGDVVTIPVLDNDTHPSGLDMHVAAELVEPLIDPERGEAFVSQDAIRFRAGDEAGTVHATYNVEDENGQVDAGYVTIQILPLDDDRNSAPTPRDATVRALSGSTVNIPIPLDGIDADGDSVELLGLDSSPKKGRLVEVAQDYLVYQAFEDSSGVDVFTYRVRDNLGAEGTATIRVGIAPNGASNQAPYAVKDSVVVRPGREIAVPVMVNDSDPEGDAIALVEDGIALPDDVPGLDARVSGDRVLVQAPDRPVETSVQYTIVDARGAEATAVLQVTVDEDVPLLPPVARDDRVVAEDLADGPVVDVDVLANDEDPDGTTDSLRLSVEPAGTILDDRSIRVTVGEKRSLIRYTITDQDDQATSAFIFVPSLADLGPVVDATKGIEVVSGETVRVPLDDYVTVAGGGSVVITEAEKVGAAHANGDPLVEDERTLVYTSAEGYYGSDALNFEVTDGTGPDDPEGRRATLAIPITVIPAENQPPSFLRGEMVVAPGEPAVGLDLARLTDDPDPGDQGRHEFEYVDGAVDGLHARIDGTRLVVEADADVPKGTAASLTVSITDGVTEPIEGTVDVRVTASTRPLPTANDDVFGEVDQGSTLTVPVLENDFNPFEAEGDLRLISAERESGSGTATIVGDRVEVTPAADFIGTLVIRYRIGDMTDDPDREVDGKILLTVQGRPDAPGTPTVSSVQDRTVVLSWSPPASNGAPIGEYTVRSVQGGSYQRTCASTTCTLDGLTNNVEYVFQVTATNRVGESDPSPSSAVARPDARPDTPAAPRLTFGDGELRIDWTTPTTPGSPVQYYTIELIGGLGAGQKTNITGNSYVWSGLENGASYIARIQAHNLAPEPSSWSPDSLPEVPAGPPLAPEAPSTAELAPVGDRAQMQVSWNVPDHNGDAIDEYRLLVHRGGSVVQRIQVSAGQTTQAVVIPTSTTAYTFTVQAQNKAGWGDESPASAPRRAAISPEAPSRPSASPGDGTIRVSGYALSAGQLNGATAGEVRYEYNLGKGGGWQSGWDGTTISGVSNGTSYAVSVRAISRIDGKDYVSDGSPSAAAVIPFGKPLKPTVTVTENTESVTFHWSSGGDNGSPITRTEISTDGGASWKTASGTSLSLGNGRGQSYSIQVRMQNAAGMSPVASESGSTAAPLPVLQAAKGRATDPDELEIGSCTSTACAKVDLVVHDFPTPGRYTLYCEEPAGNWAYDVFDVPRNGTVETACIFGKVGQKVTVHIQELGLESEPVTWK